MKRLWFSWIWQYVGGGWIGYNPIGIEFEYDKFEPAIGFKFVLLGVGFQVIWICPWDTEESIYAKECMQNNVWQIISLDPEMMKEEANESEVVEKE